jgi:type V secretory pathway adhesin AidA
VATNPASCSPSPCAPGALAVDHSAFADSNVPLLDGGSNVANDPGFVNAAALDFQLAPGSAAIDAGVADLLTEGTDRDGRVRFQGAGLDLGAYEATPVPAPSGPAADPAAPGVPAPRPAVAPDPLAPVSATRD